MADVDFRSATQEKVALFRRLFRGRDDIHARRFDNPRTGKSGYSIACGNEWVRGLCRKPQISCSDCQHQRFLPLTDAVIDQHLRGQDEAGRPVVAGVYPLLKDESCHFLAVDFDKAGWQADALAFVEACRRLRLPVALERSRSGNGGHVWLFFESAVPAALARRLGTCLMTAALEDRPDIGFDSYDRLFSSQDTMPRGGFGNLIALPLQKEARALDNSVFVDDGLRPWKDQWAFLARLGRISRARAEEIGRDAERSGRLLPVRLAWQDDAENQPWTLSPSRRPADPEIAAPLPAAMEVILGDQLYVEKQGLPPALRTRLLRLAAFQNPEFYRAQSMRLPTYGKPRIICCAEDHPLHIALPRGCLDDLQRTLRELGVGLTLREERCVGHPLAGVGFQGELRPGQVAAARALLRHDAGVLAATTAFGKTVVAAWLIARRGVSTLVLVHRQQLLDQWVERLATFLGVPAKSIGRIGRASAGRAAASTLR